MLENFKFSEVFEFLNPSKYWIFKGFKNSRNFGNLRVYVRIILAFI